MNIFYRIYNPKQELQKKEDLIIIHGLFGLSDNWVNIGKTLSKDRRVIIPDLRNHGQSPNYNNFSMENLVDDLLNLIEELNCNKPIILGHSLGGKLAINFALKYPEKTSKIIIADIGLKPIKPQNEHLKVFEIMENLPLDKIKSISEAKKIITEMTFSKDLTFLILKNIKITKTGFKWKINHQVIKESLIQGIENECFKNLQYEKPTLFLKGEKSNYIDVEDYENIYKIFPKASIKTIQNSGHWLHVDNKSQFLDFVESFI